MSINSKKTTLSQGVISILFLSALSCILYATYLTFNKHAYLEFHTHLLTAWYLVTPPWVMAHIEKGEITGAILGALLVSAHFLVIGVFATGVGFYVYSAYSTFRGSSHDDDEPLDGMDDTEYLTIKHNEARIVLVIPEETQDGAITSTTLENVFPEVYMHLKREKLNLSRPPQNPIEKLEVALLEILCAHRAWPADPAGYHSKVNLYDHSLKVSDGLIKATKNHPLARAIGLAHDIGKIASYTEEREESGEMKWNIVSKQHDKLSAHIVRMLPETHDLSSQQRNTINTVLAFCHTPDRLPKRKTTHSELQLIKALREADGISTANDQTAIEDVINDREIIQQVANAMKQIIPLLKINTVKEEGKGYADGWTSSVSEYIGVKEQILREKLIGYLPQKTAAALSLPVSLKEHPATKVIIEALRLNKYLIDSYKNKFKARPLYDLKVGIQAFYNIVLLDREVLETEFLDIVEAWGDCQYKLRVIHLDDTTQKGDNQNETQEGQKTQAAPVFSEE